MKLFSSNGNCEELKKKLKSYFPQLTETDLDIKEGMDSSMLRMIEYKLRKTKQEMKDILAKIGYFFYEK